MFSLQYLVSKPVEEGLMKLDMGPLGHGPGLGPRVVEVKSLTRWSQTPPAHGGLLADYSGELPAHKHCPFPYNPTLNHKVVLWNGDISELSLDAIVHSTNESMSERTPHSDRIHQRAGRGLRDEIINEVIECRTGGVRVTQGHNLPARFIIHTVGPKYNIKYQTAAENSLHMCYRNVLQKAKELNLQSLGLCVINSVRRNYPPDRGAHIALRTLRRHLELPSYSQLDAVVLAVDNVDLSIYEVLLPLYFPRSSAEEAQSRWLLPADIGGSLGEPVLPDRQIRIIDNPHHAFTVDRCVGCGGSVHSGSCSDVYVDVRGGEAVSVSEHIGEHAFSQMQGDLDQQRLLGERPTADIELVRQIQSKERYERLLRRARTEDLSEVSGIGCLYQSGVDRFGRPVIVFVGKWFRFKEIDLDKALLYLIYLLDPLVKSDYVIAYFHTLTSTANYPSFQWLKEVYNILPYKYKKNLKACYVVHPTFWTKMMTWWFTTFMAPAIKHKVHSLPGVEYLYEIMSRDDLEIPAFITEHDMTINGLHYFHPMQPT
ncbi:protein GDAP2 homolog isoform X2 [Frankliniella occidentalis]|uniref:Protein GDAP2 homolog isoform X2 n=1 Tax=Frankliniella occidentalis TaxID=133901 RepID=A0A6J1SI00_FRAOC|nr:protein GDAP2 homolog isoform X2 [Frankliniella occidentalis]